MICDNIIKNTIILFGNQIIEEDVKLIQTSKKYNVILRIRTSQQGGRNNTRIGHAPAIKIELIMMK